MPHRLQTQRRPQARNRKTMLARQPPLAHALNPWSHLLLRISLAPRDRPSLIAPLTPWCGPTCHLTSIIFLAPKTTGTLSKVLTCVRRKRQQVASEPPKPRSILRNQSEEYNMGLT